MGSRYWSTVLLLSLLVLAGCESALKIHDRPVLFSADRVNATLKYIAGHYGENPEDISIVPRIIVLHWTAIDGFEDSFAAFDPEELGAADQTDLRGRPVGVPLLRLRDEGHRVHHRSRGGG
jgi:hypothetical protein